jgi:sialate O-acetylesterase
MNNSIRIQIKNADEHYFGLWIMCNLYVSLFLFGLIVSQHAKAEVRLPGIFSNGMIIQRNQPVSVWGFGNPGEQLSVKIGRQKKSTVTDEKGNWSVKLDPLKVGTPLSMTIEGKNNKVELSDILVGDVFLCSGQSNMAMSMDACKRFGSLDAQVDAETTTLPMVRIFQTPNATFASQPAADVSGQWQMLRPDKNMSYSAIAFYFGRSMYGHLKIPIGIIRASHAGGPIESKMPLEALVSLECGKKYYEDILKRSSLEMMEKLNGELIQKWEKEVLDAKAVGQKPPPKPEPRKPVNGAYPAADWNGVIAPVIRFTKKAILWYQGEHNAGNAYNYRLLLPVMIRSWRDASGDQDIPFLFVQMPAFGASGGNESWPLLRESQLLTFKSTHNVGMVVTIDAGDKQNIHPPDKKIVAERLFLEARRLIYGETVSGCGPIFDKAIIKDSKVVVQFLRLNGALKFSSGYEGKGFSIAGNDRIFFPARVEIRGLTVEVSSPSVARPVAVRYAWEGYPDVSLFDSMNLPATPFRTDEWE